MVSLKNKTEILLRRLRSAVIRLRHKCLQLLPGCCSTPERLFSKLQVRRSFENMPSNVATDTVDSIFNRMDTQSHIYMDNMAKSMRRAGVVWLSMAREVYGSDTPMRIVNEDGSDDVALMTGEVG